jgi:hypothetical protein
MNQNPNWRDHLRSKFVAASSHDSWHPNQNQDARYSIGSAVGISRDHPITASRYWTSLEGVPGQSSSPFRSDDSASYQAVTATVNFIENSTGHKRNQDAIYNEDTQLVDVSGFFVDSTKYDEECEQVRSKRACSSNNPYVQFEGCAFDDNAD